ncbi:hypothetical protein [Rhizobium rhizogenes]|uniref:hypothetical protein n=1 Tax=Rhizobium rhizogenes TaxID=359 RepID=UPI001574BFD0|nr:hypothetical protein [Rhizobium rhizogenes]NTG94216.1 hypothetical protein [Rhizobium rhizogenes]
MNPIGYANPDEMRGKGCFTVAFQKNGHYSEPVYSAALALLPGEPVCHLVWRQARIAADDVQDYYDVARPGDKCVDGSEPFPVYATPVPLIVENVIKIPTTADEAEAMEKTGFAWLREHAPERLTKEGLSRPIPCRSADIEGLLEEAREERDMWRNRGNNHWETLRSIREIARTSGDLDRIIQWVNDAGSGYTATASATLAEMTDCAQSAEAALEEARGVLEWYASPEIYQPHPHGPAFDRRDLSALAKSFLSKLEASHAKA